MSANGPRFSTNGDGKHGHSQFNERKRQVITDLSVRFAELNKLWRVAEEELQKIPIPVDVLLMYASEDTNEDRPDRARISFYLGFVKSAGGWRICHGQTHDDFPEYGYGWKPITECPLDVRVKAVPHIGMLRERVLQVAEECLPRIDKAIANLRNAIADW